MATDNMYRKFGKIWTCGFEICELTKSRQTDRQTKENFMEAPWNPVESPWKITLFFFMEFYRV